MLCFIENERNATCGEDGNWENVPTCTKSSNCSALSENMLANGKFEIEVGNITNNTADFDTVVKFSCNEGYELLGPELSHCNSKGWTHVNNLPTCQKKTCPVPQIANSNVPPDGPSSPTYFEDNFSVRCNSRFKFKSGATGAVTLTCQANRTFDKILSCEDIDECDDGSNLCNSASTTCHNNIGGYTCPCKTGFARFNDSSCTDIKECDNDNGGCSDTCVETDGSYECRCPIGKELYQSNGFQGFNLPAGETGLRFGDVFYINHTCVAKQCSELKTVENGQYLSPKMDNYHFEDNVTLQCNDGYQVTDLTSTSAVSRCTANGTWDVLHTCEARKCALPAVPHNGVYNKTEVKFGDRLKLTCQLTNDDADKKELNAVCIYKDKDTGLGFAGDDTTKCPEINCSDPKLVMPTGGKYLNDVGPSTTTYLSNNSKFTFDCELGYDVIGASGDEEGDNVVKCKDNGRWSFGTLACAVKMCSDPGTLGDSKQVFDDYDIGSELYYTCDRDGFTVPDIKYKCQYINDNAVWSNNLVEKLPECTDTTKPTFNGSCGDTKYVDAVDNVSFNTPTASDNFNLASITMTDNIRPGDRIITDTTVTYTAVDFEGNTETCSVQFNIINRNDKPTLTCPYSKTFVVTSRNSKTYNYTEDVTVTGGNITSVNPTLIRSSVDKIGTMELITITAANEYNTESSCTYMAHFVAGACFQEELFDDVNAREQVCVTEGNELVCTSTCKPDYMFSDKTAKKTFRCTGSGLWDYDQSPIIQPHNRYFLRQNNPQYDVPFTVQHRLSFLTLGCLDAFRVAVTGSVNYKTFRFRISNLCGQSWNISDVTAEIVSNENFIYKTTMKLTLQSSVTVAAADECIQKIVNKVNSVFVVNNTNLTCNENLHTLTVETITNGQGTKNCKTGYNLDGNICLQHGPAQYFDEDTNTVKACPAGQYQNGLAQTSCKECRTGQFPNGDQTSCQRTCAAGLISRNGFYPCTPCQPNTYWTAKDKCSPCPTGYSTDGLAPDDTRCYAPCPAGQYSRTGYNKNGCTSCPVNFYQDQTGQMTCKECSDNSKTSTTGSTKSDDCIAITDECDRDYCNGHGNCSFKRHRTFCTCDADSGYYGDSCQNMYHICDGNPCKNGGTCIRGATYKDYTCSCRTNLDTCEMKVSNDVKMGSQSSSALYQTYLTRTLEQCNASCLSDSQCKEASFIANQFCLLFNDTIQEAGLIEEDFPADVHLKKECNTAYGGLRCEQDTKDDCENNNCNKSSQCKNNINGSQCICSANGGFSGIRCDVANSPCNSNPCEHGTCTPFGSVRYECSCFDGYDGVNCENNIDDCDNNPNACAYGGVCVDLVDSYECQCKSGFGGTNCENTPDFCLSNDCKGDNVCYNSLDRMEGVCTCDTALFETRYRCEMVVTKGQASTAGKNVSSKSVSDIEQCKTACQDNRECFYAIFNNALTPNCQMYNNTYTREQTEDSSFEIRKNCNNKTDVGYACDQVKVPCDVVDCNEGTCQNTNGNLDSVCSCKPGYTGSLCQHSIDDCVGNQCLNEAECVDGDQTYTCECKDGFNGSRCENNINDCPGSCKLENGRCEDRIDGFECICKAGYVGDDCEIDFNECSSNPCQHGGKCTDGENSFKCECETGYTGDLCEKMKDNCAGILTCQNGGKCISLQETSFCRCQGGATGDKCENATLLCKTLSNTDACINNGVCVTNAQGTETCTCPIVYDKDRCYMEEGMEGTGGEQVVNPKISTEIVNSADECKNLCLNNSECTAVSYSESSSSKICQFYTVGEEKIRTVVGSTHYRRNCPENYKGKSCEIVKDWCTDNPCKNDGRCKQLNPVGYECECMPGYSGATCEIVADPCANTPCLNRAVCQATSLSTHDCLCTEGRTWTGTSCKNSRTDYTMLVNAADQLKKPASLQTLFHLKTDELSVMMWLRVHMVNSEVPLGTVFALLATEETTLPEDLMFDFSLTVSKAGIYVRYGLDPKVGISFETEDLFRGILFDGEWHHLGISMTSSGMLSASLDSLHVQEPVYTSRNLQLDYNAQINLGYGHVVEYRDVKVYNKSFETSVFSKASTGGERPDIPPVQSFQNYNLYPSASMSENGSNIIRNPNLTVPNLECEDVDDIYYTSTERLVSLSAISDLVKAYDQVKQKSGSTLKYMHTIESTITWGAYPLIIIGMDKDTKNYGQCSGKLIIRYNSACPSMNESFSDTVSYRQCSATIGGYCDVKCNNDSKVLAAPLPYYITCGTLGVYDYRMPFAETYYPACVDISAVEYNLAASMKYKLETVCSQTQVTVLGIIEDRVQDSFKDNIRPKWMGICVDANCTNLKNITNKCDTDDDFNVVVQFSLVLTSMTLEAVGGGTVDIEDALKIIIRNEQLIDLKTVSGAVLQVETVVINKVLECPTGNRLDMTGDPPFCVPCSPGYYLKDGECMPCDYGHYQVNEAQTKCDECPDEKVTYRRGAKDVNECKVKCPAGQYYVKAEEMCVDCQRHFYQHEKGKNFCLPCGNEYKTVGEGSDSENDCKENCQAGWFLNGDKCEQCTRGYYKDNVGNTRFDDCRKCPDKNGKETTTDKLGSESVDACSVYKCEAGLVSSNSGCEPCDLNFYQPVQFPLSTDKCKPCPQKDGRITNTKTVGTTTVEDCLPICDAGRFFSESSCKPCERGTYKENVGDARFGNCTVCPDGKTTNNTGAISASLCTLPKCVAGQYLKENVCTDCDMDYYSEVEYPNSQVQCIPCRTTNGIVYGTEQTGTDNSSLCKPTCPGGKQYNADTLQCESCPIESFKGDDDRFGSCVECETERPGYVASNVGSKSAEQCTIRNCPAGSKINGSECTLCPKKTYQDKPRKTECIECGINLNTVGEGSTSPEACQTECGPGQEGNTSCEKCNEGMVKPNAGYELCQKCENEDRTSNENRTACDVYRCSIGKEYNIVDGKESCDRCNEGFNKSVVGNDASCQKCQDGLTTDGVGQGSCDLLHCVPGKYKAGDECVVCKAGTYKSEMGNDECTPCPDGTTTDTVTGATAATQCDTVVCPKGKYRKLGTKTGCFACEAGSFQPQSGSTGCINCTDGEITLENGQFTSDACVPECKEGEQYDAIKEQCFFCENGTYKESIGNTDTCKACPIDKTTAGPGAKQASDCSENKCQPGKYFVVENNKIVCRECQIGRYSEVEMMDTCTVCPDDKTTQALGTKSAGMCIFDCQAGAGYRTNLATCSSCPKGQYNRKEGRNSNTCKLCPAGTTNYQSGSTSCAFYISQIPDNHINLRFVGKVEVAINECTDTDSINGITNQVEQTARKVFQDRTNARYNSEQRFCHGDSCDNLDASQNPTCEVITRLKRAITHRLTISFVFYNISEFITDTLDNNANIVAVEVISQILRLYAAELSDQVKEIIFVGYQNVTIEDICESGEYPVDSGCATVQPVIKLVILRVPLVFIVKINTTCSNTLVLNSILTSLSLSSRKIFINARKNKYKNKDRSFCNNEDCDNYSLKFADKNPCSLRGAGRKRRQTGTTEYALNLVAEFKNVSDRTVDSDTNVALPTKDVISEIIEDNKDTLSPDSDEIQFSSAEEPTETVICAAGQNAFNNLCVDCNFGRYSEDGVTCVLCPKDTYQDKTGESSCKSCPSRTYNDDTGARNESACKSYCVSNPNYCNNRGVCSDSGRRSASCSCYENYEGATCSTKKEPSSHMPAILGGAIGGGAALLIIILIIVGVFMKCSRDPISSRKRHKQYHDPEYIQNEAYDGTYNHFGYHGSQVRPLAPYPSIGFPALGYKPDQSFEEAAYGGPYRYRPSIEEDLGQRDEETRFVWTA